MRNIAVFGDCSVQGITINQYQVKHQHHLYLRSGTIAVEVRRSLHVDCDKCIRATQPFMDRFLALRCALARASPVLSQVNVGNKYNREAGLSESCSSRQGDFQSLPFEDAEFDAAYQIEATCHSPDKVESCTGINSLCHNTWVGHHVDNGSCGLEYAHDISHVDVIDAEGCLRGAISVFC